MDKGNKNFLQKC